MPEPPFTRRRARRGRLAAAAPAALALAELLTALAAPPADAATIHRSRAADGGVVFSDAPVVDGRIERRSYRGDYGRPTATVSCAGRGARALDALAARWRPSIAPVALRHGLDPDLVTALVRVESCFDPRARSSAGALGLMQLMPATARALGVGDPFDVAENLEGGSRYLARMLARHGGDLELALAAYNAGPGAVARHGGVPPYPETRRYVERVQRLYARSRTAAAGGTP